MTQPARVLLVEDESAFGFAVRMTLESAGFRVQTVARGTQVEAAVESGRPDAAVVDLMLPPSYDLEGLEVARDLQTRHGIPTLILTNRFEEDVMEAAAGAADEVLNKSAGREAILASVRRLTGGPP